MLLELGSLAWDFTTRKSRVPKTRVDAKDVYKLFNTIALKV